MERCVPVNRARPDRKTEPGSLLSQWWTCLRVMYDKRAKPRHVAVAMTIVEAFRRDFGSGRASISYIKRATRMDDKTIIKTCRELADWGFVLRHVASGKATEYVPAWATAKPRPESTSGDFTSGENTSGNFPRGTSGNFPIGSPETSPVFPRESYLQSPAYKPADCKVGAQVSDGGPGADAPAASGRDFERIWLAYGKLGNKAASRRAFEAIINPDVDHIARRASAWAASVKPGQRRMPLEKWLASEKYDEADRRIIPKAAKQESDADVDHAIASARADRVIKMKVIDVGVPLGEAVTVVSGSLEGDNGGRWLRLLTDKGPLGILLEASNIDLQQAGQKHLESLIYACGVDGDVDDADDFRGGTFMMTRAGIVPARASIPPQ